VATGHDDAMAIILAGHSVKLEILGQFAVCAVEDDNEDLTCDNGMFGRDIDGWRQSKCRKDHVECV